MKSLKVNKAPGPSGVTSNLIKAAGATGVKGLFQVCELFNKKARFQSSGPRIIPYGYTKVREMSGLMVEKHRGVRLLEQDMKVYIRKP